MPQVPIILDGGINAQSDESSIQDGAFAWLANCYLTPIGDTQKAMRGNPGRELWLDLGLGNYSIDGDYYQKELNVRFVVCNGRVFKVGSDKSVTELTGATLTPGVPVAFADDGTTVFMAARSKINTVTALATTVSQLGSDSPDNVTSLGYLRGFLLANGDQAGGTPVPGDCHYSDDKAGGYSIWAWFNNEFITDGLQSIIIGVEEIFLIGSRSIEVNYLSSDPANPFAVNANATKTFGTVAPYSVAYDSDSVYFLSEVAGALKVIELGQGRTPRIISAPVDVPLEAFQRVDDAEGRLVSFRGQVFYVLTFPTVNAVFLDQIHESLTLAYHIQTGYWYQWGHWLPADGDYEADRLSTFLYISSQKNRYVGCRYESKIYTLTDTTLTDGADVLRPCIRTGWISHRKAGKVKFSAEYTYDMKTGVGNDLAPNPKMIHKWRDDYSLEWSNGREIMLGRQGERRRPPRSTRCGPYERRQHQFYLTDPVEFVFNGLYEEVEVER